MGTDDDGHAIRDALTGAYSRALLDSRLSEELSRASRSHTGCALFLFDIDYFKSINDAYGHQRGDDILRQLTERISGFIRGYDVLFRYGGDEFVLLLPDTDKAGAVRVALRLTEGIKAEPYPGEPPLTVSVSLGVAAFPDDATDAEELLAAADRRNYLAKHRGRACAVADDEESDAQPVSSRMLERELQIGVVREFLTRVQLGESGLLGVTGPRGAGHTRFLEEVGRAGRLRGFDVLAGTDVSALPLTSVDRPTLVVLDADFGDDVPEMMRRITGSAPVGVVVRTPYDATIDSELTVHDTVELLPWSAAATRIWLRTALRGEPDPVLVDWLVARTGGLPGRVASELDRLRDRDGLVRGADGVWGLDPALVRRPVARRALPNPLTELVGRQQETAQVAQLLAERRLVTLVGPGGIGKTRLSLAVGAAVGPTFDDGVVFVQLADSSSEVEVLSAIAHALDVTEVPGQGLLDTLGEALGDQSVLLILDNFEQAMDAAPVAAALLHVAPGLRILASSRERLGVYGEQVYQVPTLVLPDLDALPSGGAAVAPALATSPAVALFNTRARTAAYDFVLTGDNLPAVVELCRRLDGLPLAIELAAAHSDILSPAAILAQLTDRLDLPGTGMRGLPVRQQTMRGAIDWSFHLLEPTDQELLTWLGAFSGGCRLDAVAAVSAGRSWNDQGDLEKCLNRLADKSLVRAEPDPADGTRFVLLETVRAYARERLDEHPDASDIREMHAAHYSALANRAATELTGPRQSVWVARIQREQQNLRAAFEHSLAAAEPEAAVEVAVGLWRYWRNRGQYREGRERLNQLLAIALPDGARARVLHAAAVLAAGQDDHEGALILARESRELARVCGDGRTSAQAGNALGIALMAAGRYAEARAVFTECLDTWLFLDQPLGTAMAHGNLTMVALRLGELDTAETHATNCLRLERMLGNTRGIMLALLCLGEICNIRGEHGTARIHLDEALAASRRIGDVMGEAMARHQLGLAALHAGDHATAKREIASALRLRRDHGDREDLAVSLDAFAALLADELPGVAVRLIGAAESLRERYKLPVPADTAAEREALLSRLIERLGADAFAAGRLTGASAALDTVVDEALARG